MNDLTTVNNSPALTTHSAPYASIDGLTADDVKDYGVSLSSLKLVGQMSKEGKADPTLIGALLYDGRLNLGRELQTIVLSSQWRWSEKRVYDPANTTPANIMTNEQFQESGLTQDDATRLCILNMAIVAPEGVEDEGTISAGGREYLLASFWARGFSLDFAKAIARKVQGEYGGASYNKVTTLTSTTRAWKGETMRLVKWSGAGPEVSPETLATLASEIGGLG